MTSSALTNAIINHRSNAALLASAGGPSVITELQTLFKNNDPCIRARTVLASATLPLNRIHPILFSAVEDPDAHVAFTAMGEIERRHTQLSTDLLIGLLDKLTRLESKKRLVLVLGKRLTLAQTEHLNKYCNTDHEQNLVLHCIAALSKMGVEQRRQQFTALLRSLNDKPIALIALFDLIEYIAQPWLGPSLRFLLSNTYVFQRFSNALPGHPTSIRLCDKAAMLLNDYLSLSLPFISGCFKQYSAAELAQVNTAASHYIYPSTQ